MAVLHADYFQNNSDVKILPLEHEIYRYILHNEEGNYEDILINDNRWEVFYHFSPMRTSIINWYDFKEEASVLEIGAQFGAVTGVLCDKCKYVTAIENSELCARGITKRYEDRKNLAVYAGNIRNIVFQEKFDYIILIEEFEKACQGSKRRKEYADYLNHCVSLLKPDGKILIAVDNRMGVRYVSGAPDKYTGLSFDGIQDYPDGTSGLCFTKGELEEILDISNIKSYQFYYPLPDYTLAQEIYSDYHLPSGSIHDRVINYYLNPDKLLYDEDKLLDDAIERGEFTSSCNSYFIECCLKPENNMSVYASLSTDREKEHSFATIIRSDGKVLKRALFPEGKIGLQNSCNNIISLQSRGIRVIPHQFVNDELMMPFVEDIKLVDYLGHVVKEGSEVEEIFDKLYQDILNSSEHAGPGQNRLELDSDAEDIGVILKKAFIDMIPLNCFYKSEEIYYFDQEFMKEYYPAKYVLFRAIRYTYLSYPHLEAVKPVKTLKERYQMVSLWQTFLKEEDRFIVINRNREIYHQFYEWNNKNKGCNQEMMEEVQQYRIIKGFDVRECQDGNSWHWAVEKTAELSICNKTDMEKQYEIEFIMQPPPDENDRRVSVSVNGELIYQEILPFHYKFTMNLGAGEEKRLLFETDGACIASGGEDKRAFAFQLVNLNIETFSESYETSQAHIKLQNIELDLLKVLMTVCDKYNLKCFLIYGSLLGAVRHRGIIPWDDDIDVALLREDYDTLLEAADKEFSGKYYLQTPDQQKSFYGGYSKLRNSDTTAIEQREWGKDGIFGVSIDIFPLDNVSPESLDLHLIQRVNRFQLMLFAKTDEKGSHVKYHISRFKWNLYRMAGKVQKYSSLCKKLENVLKTANKEQYPFVSILARYLDVEKYHFYSRRDFENGKKILFSGIEVWIPNHAERYLIRDAGLDYMLNPAKENRVPHHYGFWELDTPYRDMQKHLFHKNLKINSDEFILWATPEGIEYFYEVYGKKFRPQYIVTNDHTRWGTMYEGCIVANPEDIIGMNGKTQTIVICAKEYYKIVDKLKDKVNQYYISEPDQFITIAER